MSLQTDGHLFACGLWVLPLVGEVYKITAHPAKTWEALHSNTCGPKDSGRGLWI